MVLTPQSHGDGKEVCMEEQYTDKILAKIETGYPQSGSLGASPQFVDSIKFEILRLEKQLAEKRELVELLESEPKLKRALELMSSRY